VPAAYGLACLQELDPLCTAPLALAAVTEPLVRALQRFEREGWAAFAERFAARDLLAGRAVTSTQAGVAEGVARGVAADGGLRVETPDGRLHTITSGEVSVRPAAPPPPAEGAPC
jgi:BirA family biotin operon repressor/biotin-[acetyl-CoA-carboxylase] ligase